MARNNDRTRNEFLRAEFVEVPGVTDTYCAGCHRLVPHVARVDRPSGGACVAWCQTCGRVAVAVGEDVRTVRRVLERRWRADAGGPA